MSGDRRTGTALAALGLGLLLGWARRRRRGSPRGGITACPWVAGGYDCSASGARSLVESGDTVTGAEHDDLAVGDRDATEGVVVFDVVDDLAAPLGE